MERVELPKFGGNRRTPSAFMTGLSGSRFFVLIEHPDLGPLMAQAKTSRVSAEMRRFHWASSTILQLLRLYLDGSPCELIGKLIKRIIIEKRPNQGITTIICPP